MGRYDDIEPESLKSDLAAFARLVLRLEKDDRLLQAAPELQQVMGDLRQKLFAYEVRSARQLRRAEEGRREGEEASRGPEDEDPTIRESLRVVREALEREREALGEWDPDEDDPDGGDHRGGP